MKIGIIRHFKVDYKKERLMDYKGFEKYASDYNSAGVIKNEVDMGGIKWDKCYCSDLSRAVTTAETVYHGNISVTPLLREVEVYPFRKWRIFMPQVLWDGAARIAWKLNGKSQIETSSHTVKRALEFIKMMDLDKNQNILIVSHGFFLITLVKELKKLGFKGKVPLMMKNGCLYLLEKE